MSRLHANGSPPLVVIVGQTASGKTALALALAKQFNGEIIAADSRTIYKGMDIGTAKPSRAEMDSISHHLINIIEPHERFSAAEFQRLAKIAIREIHSRGKLPILVGGTGLYVDAILYDFNFRSPANLDLRTHLSDLSVNELRGLVQERELTLPQNEYNPRHLIRTLETNGQISVRQPLRPNTLVLGLSVDKDILDTRIAQRVDRMVRDGFEQEVRRLTDAFGWDAPGLQAPGYRAFRGYIEGRTTLEEAKQQFIQNDRQYAKRQKTWFKRDTNIIWISNSAKAVDLITSFLNN